jgi:hypothetical protein
MWTKDKETVLESMWLWGHSSEKIAQVLPEFTRNAVMGKLNRLGLMGRKGEYLHKIKLESEINREDVEDFIQEILNETPDFSDQTHLYLGVALTSIFAGRDAGGISEKLRLPLSKVEKVLKAYDSKGIWKEGHPPPLEWWKDNHGNMAMILDAISAMGIIRCMGSNSHGERLYVSA